MIHVYRFVFFILQLRNRVGGTYVPAHAVTTSDWVSLKIAQSWWRGLIQLLR